MQVAFYDVDSYRVVWHGNYPKYFEIARCKLLEKIGFTYNDMEATGYFYPIIDLRVKYVRPLLFEQKFDISAEIKEWENKLVIDYRIVCAEEGVVINKARSTQIAVLMPEQITQFESPKELVDKVESALKKGIEQD